MLIAVVTALLVQVLEGFYIYIYIYIDVYLYIYIYTYIYIYIYNINRKRERERERERDAPIHRCSLTLCAPTSFLRVASQSASLYVRIRRALVLHAVFPIEFKSKSWCNEHIPFLSVSSARFRLVSSITMARMSRVDEWISFVERCKSFGATAKTFEVPRGHVTVTDSLRQIFLTRSSDDVMQMMTVLQWFFGPE